MLVWEEAEAGESIHSPFPRIPLARLILPPCLEMEPPLPTAFLLSDMTSRPCSPLSTQRLECGLSPTVDLVLPVSHNSFRLQELYRAPLTPALLRSSMNE